MNKCNREAGKCPFPCSLLWICATGSLRDTPFPLAGQSGRSPFPWLGGSLLSPFPRSPWGRCNRQPRGAPFPPFSSFPSLCPGGWRNRQLVGPLFPFPLFPFPLPCPGDPCNRQPGRSPGFPLFPFPALSLCRLSALRAGVRRFLRQQRHLLSLPGAAPAAAVPAPRRSFSPNCPNNRNDLFFIYFFFFFNFFFLFQSGDSPIPQRALQSSCWPRGSLTFTWHFPAELF